MNCNNTKRQSQIATDTQNYIEMNPNYPNNQFAIALMAVITGLSIASCATSQSPTPSALANTPISNPAPQKSPSRAYAESNTIERMAIIYELEKPAKKGDSAAIKELVKLGQKSDGATGGRIHLLSNLQKCRASIL